jgi:hypothetical protein
MPGMSGTGGSFGTLLAEGCGKSAPIAGSSFTRAPSAPRVSSTGLFDGSASAHRHVPCLGAAAC